MQDINCISDSEENRYTNIHSPLNKDIRKGVICGVSLVSRAANHKLYPIHPLNKKKSSDHLTTAYG